MKRTAVHEVTPYLNLRVQQKMSLVSLKAFSCRHSPFATAVSVELRGHKEHVLLYLRRGAHARAKQLGDIKGDHPWRTGGRPTQEGKSNQSIRKRLDFNPSVGLDCNECGLKGTPCHQQQSVHLKRAALLTRLFAELE